MTLANENKNENNGCVVLAAPARTGLVIARRLSAPRKGRVCNFGASDWQRSLPKAPCRADKGLTAP